MPGVAIATAAPFGPVKVGFDTNTFILAIGALTVLQAQFLPQHALRSR